MRQWQRCVWVGVAMAAASCSSGSSEGSSEATSGGEKEPTLMNHMDANFEYAISARDGVIAGSLIQAREAAVKLAETDYAVLLPPDWMPIVEDMQAAAREITAAPDRQAMADAVATVAATCGDCHGMFSEGDRGRAITAPLARFGEAEDMHERMLRHQRAVTGFWYGLTIPSDTAWKSGAQQLLLAPAKPTDAEGQPVSDETIAGLEKVRAIAKRALDATETEDRIAIYGEFLASCAGCHQGGG